MQGRITSVERDPAGVPWEEVYKEARKAHARVLAAHREALQAWLAYAKAHPEKKAKLHRVAVELTEKALG